MKINNIFAFVNSDNLDSIEPNFKEIIVEYWKYIINFTEQNSISSERKFEIYDT